jgi:hypothetical protein
VSIAWRIITDWVGRHSSMSQSERDDTSGMIGGDDPQQDPAPGGAVVGEPGLGAGSRGEPGAGDLGGEGDLAPEPDEDDPRPAAGA